jgi:hypothetical protein
MKKLLLVPVAIGATESLDTLSDPYKAEIPPYLPGSPRMREIWAHMYDLLAVFDQGVGDLVGQLEEDVLDHDYEPLVLQAAISTRQLEEKAEPLLPAIENRIMPKYSGNVWGRYRTWSYPMFIGMALDQAMINCGIDLRPIP